LDIILLGSYDGLIGMDWIEKHCVVLDCCDKVFTCLDEEEDSMKMKGIARDISFPEISTLHMKIIFRKEFQIYATHMEEPMKDKGPSLEDCLVLKKYEDVFEELPVFPPKRDMNLSIELISGVSPIFKTPNRMSMLELK
jgi:hypothetical protein